MSAAELVAASRVAQGLPPTISDPTILATVAALLDAPCAEGGADDRE